jgi:hypothetical protein
MPTPYAERLYVPLRWWVQTTMAIAVLWIAFIVAIPAWIAWASTVAMLVLAFGLLLWVGQARVAVQDGVLYAGPAHIDLRHVARVETLDKEGTRRVHGVEADARAFLVTRPYVSRSVRVFLDDPADPTPYWLISTRHPRTLATAITGD